MGILRGERRGEAQDEKAKRGSHAPASGPITVTVCIIPPCM
jgi:hypothetical protein